MRPASHAQASALRAAAPACERKLWALLRGRRLEGLKFRRQVPIGPYVVDFLCFRHRLAVEADGPFHDPASDARRDAWLQGQGFRTLRFTNHEIDLQPQAVLDRIRAAAGRPALLNGPLSKP